MKKLFLFLIICLISIYCRHEVDDLFSGLYTKPIYSGYLKTDIEGNELFYIFTPSQSDTAATDPVLLWLNGGPGCSSLSGFLDEHGCVISELYSDKLEVNKYSWNLNANVIYIESPAGVGYSKSTDTKQPWTDDKTAKSLVEALKNFFSDFKEYSNNDFYISGESYAGVYIPFATMEILKNGGDLIKIFKGVLIGNGLTDFETDIEYSLIETGYYHSLVSIETFHAYLRNCPHYTIKSNYPPPKNVTKRCNEIRTQVQEDFNGIDVYGIYRMCPYTPQKPETTPYLSEKAVFLMTLKKIKEKRYQEYYANHPEEISNDSELEPEIEIWPNGCDEDATTSKFLNDASIREKLGVDSSIKKWAQCNFDVYDAYEHSESFNFYNTVIKEHSELRVWFFTGETDLAVPFLGSIRWMDKLNQGIEVPYTAWHIKNQVAGHYQKFDSGLVFLTVKGTGHMVPQDKKPESKILLDAFLSGNLPK